ncbi:MAG: glycosyltransferase family 2 protein [Elusimicrobia bacterium]|nr:glycosyltransferase family 2 protein [Elusimicrobiota bacterium]
MSASEPPRALSIIVPVYNERATLTALLDRVLAMDLKGLGKDIIIVEGNSTDGTRDIVRGYEGRPGVTVVYEEGPRGKGAAVRAGLARAAGEFLLIQDGDLEYDPADTPRLLEPLLRGDAQVVFGSRVMTSPQHWQFRRLQGAERLFGFLVNLGGVLFTGLFNRLYGTHLSDGATMYKLFRTADLKALTLKSDGFDYDWELSAKLAKKGLRFAELPVFYKARSLAEGKKIRFWRDGWRVLMAILRYRFSD